MFNGLERYIIDHIRPGGFLTAVLQNDLQMTTATADDDNFKKIKEWCQFIYNELPQKCWGSKEKVEKWVNQTKSEDDLKEAQ